MRNPIGELYWLVRSRSFEALCLAQRCCFEYSNLRFAKADRSLRASYQVCPLSRCYGSHQGEVAYGETPLVTMRRLVEQLRVQPHHRVLELGCGTGRVALWLATQVGCRVIAVDRVAQFITFAQRAAKEAGIGEQELCFYQSDLLSAPFDQVDLVYLYGLGLPNRIYEQLCERLQRMKNPPWVVTIGGSLSEYSCHFSVMQQLPVVFPWGWTHAYLNVAG